MVMLVMSRAEKKSTNLMNVLEELLNDPEYLSLSDFEQLHILEAIYSTLEKSIVAQSQSNNEPEHNHKRY